MNANFVNHSNLLKSKLLNISKYSIWNNLNILFVIILFFLSIFFIFSYFTSHVHYQIVCKQISNEDSILIISKLIKMRIPYRYIINSGELLVPEYDISKVHLMLLSEGLPKQKNVGFELMDQEKFGMSSFNMHINYQRALEGELARSIQRIHSIKTVKVHIAFPQKSSFLKNNILPSASVIIGFKHGKYLDFKKCRAMTDLIAASVPELLPKNIVILDEDGNYLNKKNLCIKNTNSVKLNTIKLLEKKYCSKILYILEPIIQLKNFRIQVHITKINNKNYCKHRFQFNKNKKFMSDKIHSFLFLIFSKKNKNNLFNSSEYKYNMSVLVLINYFRNERNQLVPLNITQTSKIKNLITEVVKSNKVNFLDIKIINIKFHTDIPKIMYYNYFLYFLNNIPMHILCMIIFIIFFLMIKFLHILKVHYIDNIVQVDHIKLRSQSMKIDNINNIFNSNKDLQDNLNNNEFIKNISKSNSKLIAMIIQNWINKKK